MATRFPFEINEWYHCYNRGVDKRKVFLSLADRKRFQALLYVCNGTKNIRLAELYDTSLEYVLTSDRIDRGLPLVEIGAYSLMPNHLHFVFREIRGGGTALFMQKVFTGYTMYFNRKHERTGALFAGSFKSKHLDNDRYLKQCVAYVLLNPVELFDPRWKEGRALLSSLKKRLAEYPFSSLVDFIGVKRPENKIISTALDELYERKPTFADLLEEAQEYYAQRPKV